MNEQERTKEEQLAFQSATASGIPYFDTRDFSPKYDELTTFDRDQLAAYRVAPLHSHGTALELGLTDQTDRTKLPTLQQEMGATKLTFKTISHVGYKEISNQWFYHSFKKERDGDFAGFGKRLAASAPKQAFQYIAQLAFWMGASDIHIEPGSEQARIRFRLDGTLHPITTVNTESYRVFLSDLQTRAEIKWGSHEPQTGRISFELMNNVPEWQTVNMRIETIPTFHGEEIVVRIFNAATVELTLTTMGFAPTQIQRLTAVTSHPNGMVLTVGPTGSGKTSTLYAVINQLNSPEVKIATLEDPVEYDLPGISQIPIQSDDPNAFAKSLRAVMREDPNVVMIGEIRDLDTAKTAIQASLTGHLVLSTFHAANASAAITRMTDMISQNTLFASAIRLIIAQRLARRVCSACQEKRLATAKELSSLQQIAATLPAARRPALSPETKLTYGKGCAACHGLGYKGRIAIIEMLPITPDIERLMIKSTTTAQDIQELAVKNGMATIVEDGLQKVLAGITTIEEIEGFATN